MAIELVLMAEGSGERRRLASGALTLGRATGNDWVLPDTAPEPTLSRRHCRIALGGDGWALTDLGSTNGTRLNGRPVPAQIPTPLQKDDVIELGPHRLRVTFEDKEAERAAAVPQASRSLLDDDPFGFKGPTTGPRPGSTPLQPRAGTSAASLDELFSGWGTPDRPAAPPPRPTPPAVTDDPLEGLFKEQLEPLPRSRDTSAEPTPAAESRPHYEALLPGTSSASPSEASRPPSDDPFGLLADADRRSGPPVARAAPAEPIPSPSALTGQNAPAWSHPQPERQAPGSGDDDPFGLGERGRAVASAQGPPLAPVRPDPMPAPRAGSAAVGPSSATTTPDRAVAIEAENLLRSFLQGAGLADVLPAPADPQAFMREAGQAFARLAEGLRELLEVRATVKDHARLDRTQIGAAQNNPLKYSINAREAALALLRRREEGYMGPLAAIEAGFRDLKAHELAVLEGLQSAVAELLRSFDPQALENRLADAGTVALLLQGGRRARLWELYTERYEEIAKSAGTRFMGHFDGAFRQAYERKSAQVAQHEAGPAAARGDSR